MKIRNQATPKIGDRGVQCMFVGHPQDHDSDCYEMWQPESGSLNTSRDMIWLKGMHCSASDRPSEATIEPANECIDDREQLQNDLAKDNMLHGIQEGNVDRCNKMIKSMKQAVEMAMVGAVGGALEDARDLIPMKCNEAMKKDKDGWTKRLLKNESASFLTTCSKLHQKVKFQRMPRQSPLLGRANRSQMELSVLVLHGTNLLAF